MAYGYQIGHSWIVGFRRIWEWCGLVEKQYRQSIFLVEEDRDTALAVKLQLDLDGYDVEMFTDPVMALEKYHENPKGYSLVIVDMKMIGMSTFDFLREIKKDNLQSKILLITSFEIKSAEFSKVSPSSKVSGFIERPQLQTRLISSIREILNVPGGNGLNG